MVFFEVSYILAGTVNFPYISLQNIFAFLGMKG